MTARAGLTVVGQIAGASFGPIGAAIGGAIGGIVGGAIDGPQRNTQALLDDLGAVKFDYGSSWPRLYGVYRVKLTPIWSSTKRAVPHEEEVNSKGGPDQINRTFTYEQDWLCWAPLNATGWARIWINGKLRASRLADADAETIEASAAQPAWADVTFFDGAADQLPWAVYEAAVGTADACAYRHRPTLAFGSLDLGTSGQPPLVEVEFASGGSVVEPGSTIKFGDEVAITGFLQGNGRPWGAIAFGNPTRVPTFSVSATLIPTTAPGCCPLDGEGFPRWSPPDVAAIICWDVDHSGEATQVSQDVLPTAGFGRTPGIGTGNRAIVAIASNSVLPIQVAIAGDGASAVYALPDEDNWLGIAELRFAVWDSMLALGTTLAVDAKPPSIDGTYVGNRGNIYICTDAGVHVSTIPAGIAVESMAMNDATVWALSSGNVYPFSRATLAGDTPFACAGSAIFVDASGDLCYVLGSSVYRRDAGAWLLLGTMTGPVDTTHFFGATAAQLYAACGATTLVLSADSFDIRAYDTAPYPTLDAAVQDYASYYFNSFTFDGGGKRATRGECICVYEIETLPGAVASWAAQYSCERLYGYPGDSTGNFDLPLDEWVWDPASTTVYIDLRADDMDLKCHDLFRQPFVSLIEPETIPLSEIVQAEETLSWSGEAGALTTTDIDVTELEDTPVRGFLTTGSPRESVAQLMDVFYFGVVCSDKLYHRLRGAASIGTVAADDTGAGVGGAGEIFAGLERGNDLEQAIQVAVTGPNTLTDYEPGTEISDRLVGESVELRRYTTAVVFTPAERKGRADTMVLDGRVASHTGQVSLDDRHVEKEPFDVWTQLDDEGNAYRVRADRETYADGVRTFDLVLDDATVLSSLGITTETDSRALIVRSADATDLLLLDIPALRDTDATAPGFYAAGRGAGPRWSGYSLLESADGVSFGKVLDASVAAVSGTCTTTLGDWGGGNVVDNANSVTVNSSAALASYTDDQIIAGTAQAYLIGDEIIVAREATLVSAGVYTLSGLQRGLRGTEWAIGAHVADERFVQLDTGTRRVTDETPDLDVERYWKGVSYGKRASDVAAVTFADTGVSLKPFAPVDLEMTLDAGDDVLTWHRRSRLAGRLLNTTQPQLGETSESYSVELRDGSDAIVSTDTVTEPRWVSPGGSLAGYSLTVYQLSSIVGRGYPATLEIPA